MNPGRNLMGWTVALLIAAATIAISMPFARNGAWPWAAAAMAVGLCWLVAVMREYDWMASVGLAAFTMLTASAVLNHAALNHSALYWALPGVLAALAAWDLCHLRRRLRGADHIENQAAFLRAHLIQLSAVLLAAWGLGLLAMQISISIAFPWTLALVLTLVASLAVVVRTARRTETTSDFREEDPRAPA